MSGVVATSTAPFGQGWQGGIQPQHQVPSPGFEPQTSTPKVRRSTKWATWRQNTSFLNKTALW